MQQIRPPIQTAFPIAGDNIVGKYHYREGKIYINQKQYIDNVPQSVWEFWVGGYQPLQSYLKHRKSRELDIAHYQNIIAVLTETEKITKEIDNWYCPIKSLRVRMGCNLFQTKINERDKPCL